MNNPRKNFLKFEQVHIPKAILVNLYTRNRLSIKEVASVLALNVATIHRKLHRYKIKVRPKGRKRTDITAVKLIRLRQRNMSVSQIANHFSCSQNTVRKRMDEFAIPCRVKAASITNYPKKEFNGDSKEAAYMVGFVLADFNAGKQGELIHLKTSTTRTEQVELFQKLFNRYTYTRKSNRFKSGAIKIDCYLDNSFNFLLAKKDYIPKWIKRRNNIFTSFVAGYIDGEGSFGLTQGRARFKIDSYDRRILYEIHRWLARKGINSRFWRISKAGTVRADGYSLNKDLWRLIINDGNSFLRFTDIIKCFVRHRKRRKDMFIGRANIIERKRKGTIP